MLYEAEQGKANTKIDQRDGRGIIRVD